jgi:hypothetical protein
MHEGLCGDSYEYEILQKGVLLSPVEGIFLEIGLRRAGGTKLIIDTLHENGVPGLVIAIDPYGNIGYQVSEDYFGHCDYTNEMRNETLSLLYEYIRDKNINFMFYNMEDIEFFYRYSDGIPVYTNSGKFYHNQYAFVHFDGPHSVKDVLKEIEFFLPRVVQNSCFVFDDINSFDHSPIEKVMEENKFKLIEKGERKSLFRKVND